MQHRPQASAALVTAILPGTCLRSREQASLCNTETSPLRELSNWSDKMNAVCNRTHLVRCASATALTKLLKIVPHAFVNLTCYWRTRSLRKTRQAISRRSRKTAIDRFQPTILSAAVHTCAFCANCRFSAIRISVPPTIRSSGGKCRNNSGPAWTCSASRSISWQHSVTI
jgi:hypothetical protein